jgi:Ca-activated chloride channel homolog
MNALNAFIAKPDWHVLLGLFPKIGFLWPTFLWGLLLVPVIAAVYVLLLRRRKKGALNYANVAMVRRAVGVTGWRRHVPPVLMLGALTLLMIAIARPTAEVSLPSTRATVMLAMDVSGSMRAADVNPSRIEAAQAAAKQYIKDQPSDVQIGIVAFAATALLVQNPTTDRTSLNAAIDRFELQRGTAVGSGILVSLSTLFPQDDFPISTFNGGGFGRGNGGAGFGGGANDFSNRFGGRALGDNRGPSAKAKHVPVEPGSYKNAVVILLTDGATNAGYDPIQAARIASEYGVKVYTVGFGSTRGSIVGFGGFQMRAQIDEEALKKIADMTRGRYFHAASAEELKAVYSVLSKQLIIETQQMEITSFFAAAAALLMMVSAGLSLAWFGRIL